MDPLAPEPQRPATRHGNDGQRTSSCLLPLLVLGYLGIICVCSILLYALQKVIPIWYSSSQADEMGTVMWQASRLRIARLIQL